MLYTAACLTLAGFVTLVVAISVLTLEIRRRLPPTTKVRAKRGK